MKAFILPAVAAALVLMALPSPGGAYGARHVGYTHVGPGGVYHTGRTAVAGPGGVRVGGSTTAAGYGGGVYRGGYRAGVGYGGAVGGAAGYRYAGGYGGAAVGGYRYVR
jgi:hypothetical protein